MPLDDSAHGVEVAGQQATRGFGVGLLAAAGGADNVGEQDGDGLAHLARRRAGRCQRGAAVQAEPRALGILLAAARATDHAAQCTSRESRQKEEARRNAGLLVGLGYGLVALALAAEAVAAVDGLRATWTERDQRLLAAVRARRAEHLARRAIVAAAAAGVAAVAVAAATVARTPACRLTDGATGRASTRLAELAVCVELLLARGEREVLAAICTGQRLVGHG